MQSELKSLDPDFLRHTTCGPMPGLHCMQPYVKCSFDLRVSGNSFQTDVGLERLFCLQNVAGKFNSNFSSVAVLGLPALMVGYLSRLSLWFRGAVNSVQRNLK